MVDFIQCVCLVCVFLGLFWLACYVACFFLVVWLVGSTKVASGWISSVRSWLSLPAASPAPIETRGWALIEWLKM